MSNQNLIAHLRLGVSRNKEPYIKTLKQRMEEDYIELIGSWAIAKEKLPLISKIICYCGDKRYIAKVKSIKNISGVNRAYLNHETAKLESFSKNYGYQIGHTKLGINKFYTGLDEQPIS